MTKPTAYSSSVSIPLPDDSAIRRILGDGYDPGQTLNVVKMFAGTDDRFPALISMVQAIFSTEGIDARHLFRSKIGSLS